MALTRDFKGDRCFAGQERFRVRPGASGRGVNAASQRRSGHGKAYPSRPRQRDGRIRVVGRRPSQAEQEPSPDAIQVGQPDAGEFLRGSWGDPEVPSR